MEKKETKKQPKEKKTKVKKEKIETLPETIDPGTDITTLTQTEKNELKILEKTSVFTNFLDKCKEIELQILPINSDKDKLIQEVILSVLKNEKIRFGQTLTDTLLAAKAFIKRINAVAKPAESKIDELFRAVKLNIFSYEDTKEKERQAVLRQLELERQEAQRILDKKRKKDEPPVAITAPPNFVHLDPPVKRTVQVAKIWTYEVIETDQVPLKYWEVSDQKIREAVASGVREIAGVKIYQKESMRY